MPAWREVEAAVPDLAAAVRAVFDAHKHKVIGTLRADGSPRVSGNEAMFSAGELWLGMMDGSVKARDLLRDPRLAIHSATADPEMKQGDAKLAGRAVEVTDPEVIRRFGEAVAEEHQGAENDQGAENHEEAPEPFHLFQVDVTEVSLVRIGDPADHLVIESWSEAAGYRRTERR
jgi:hypothetical protein